MTLSSLFKQAEKFAVDNSPAILTGIGAAGTVVTAYLAGRAAYKMGLDVNAGHYEPLLEGLPPEKLSAKEKFKTYGPMFIPAAGVGMLTVTSIIMAHNVGSRRAAAVAAAYSLSEKAFSEYRDKVIEKVGGKKNQTIYDEIAQNRVNQNPASTREVVITGNGDVMCYDTLTGRYFLSSMEKIRAAANDVNQLIIAQDYASLSTFYDRLGLSATSFSEEVGWRVENLLEIRFSTVISEDGQPCLAIHYETSPIRDYFRNR